MNVSNRHLLNEKFWVLEIVERIFVHQSYKRTDEKKNFWYYSCVFLVQ